MDFKPKETLDEQSLSFSITVMDVNNPTTSRVTTTIKIGRDPETSIPKSPTFEHQWYLIKMNDSINETDKLIPENGPIKLENYDDINSVQLVTEGDAGFTSHFDIQKRDSEVEIKLTTKFLEPEPQFGFITLKVVVENAAQPGYSVLNIVFPPPECPATTTAEPCTTPEITTTTSTTVTTVSSTTGISTTTDENISPTSTEDPCSRCPTITTECPTETTITEPTATTTIHPVSKTTPEMKTTTEDPCSSCPTTITDCPDVTTTEATSCPVCNESTTASSVTIWSTDVTSSTTEATSCPACDCSSTVYTSESSPATGSCQPCETCTTPEVTTCPTCDCTSTTRDSSSTTSCPTSEPCPSREPPTDCDLYFPLNNYTLTLHAGDSGEIGIVEALSDPPMDPWNIHYNIFDGFGLREDFSIIDGKMYSLFPLEAKDYKFTVSPYAQCYHSEVNAKVHLHVYSIDVCGNESDVEVLFPEGVQFSRVYEETYYAQLSSPLLIPPSLDCDFSLEVEPKMTRVAHDADVGDNAKVTYHVTDTSEVVIEEYSGYYYPHPNFFEYKDFEFTIVARNEESYSDCSVKVKILAQKYLTDLRVKGAQVADAQEVVKKISIVTGLDVGFVTARLVKSYSSKDWEENSFEVGIFGKTSYAFTDDMKEMPLDDLRTDDTFSLRLLVYAFKDGEAVDTNTFQEVILKFGSEIRLAKPDFVCSIFALPTKAMDSLMNHILVSPCMCACAIQLDKIGGPMIAKAYVPVQYVVADQNAAVIGLSVTLALLILGVIGFIVYRFWMKRRNCDNDSLERGLVSEKNDDIRDDSDFIYKSEKASISSGETGMADQTQDPDDLNPERRKSVAFAEEPQVIPGDDEEPQSNITGSVIDVKM
ncbi:hypothetical protein J437_LFUL006017 [Ladona fulva]|uniref:Uncharacterized protein n=1 Tax=Ladona fulva TaxID=123851 RepID=A0A8K0NWY1_LADFU|nr:hypothetical protein J437_LFUL006017 [Ladona fulva]